MRLTHLFPTYRNLGGVEAVLRGHWEHDASFGVESNFIIFSEAPEPKIDRIDFLNWTEETTTHQARRTFASAIQKQSPEVCVYHGAWPMKLILDLDSADRRILQFHGSPGNYAQIMRDCAPWLDAAAAISQPQFEKLKVALPEFEKDRTERLACPIHPPPAPSHSSWKNRAIVIGYCGRLADDAKRVDRAPAFIQELNKSGLNFRMEFLGDGPLEPELREEFKNDARIVFHGRKSGDSYWRTLQAWDIFVLFSDSEGTPISILETMDQGILPLVPQINSGADYYAKQLGPDFVYPPYDFSKACDLIHRLFSQPDQEIEKLRKQACAIVAEHRPENYFKNFSAFVKRIQSLPRHSRRINPLRPWPLDFLKFKTLTKLSKIRQKLS